MLAPTLYFWYECWGYPKFADEKKWTIDEWVEETVSGAINVKERRLGSLLQKMQANDVLVATELSRIGRSSM